MNVGDIEKTLLRVADYVKTVAAREAAATEKIQEAIARIDVLEGELAKTRKELTDAHAANFGLEAQVARAEGLIARLREKIAELSVPPVEPPVPPPVDPPVDPPVVPPTPPGANPAAAIHAMLDLAPKEVKAAARARVAARRRPRPRHLIRGETFGAGVVPEVRDAVCDMEWQWVWNRALGVRPAPMEYPAGDLPGDHGSVPVRPPVGTTRFENLELGEMRGHALLDARWFIRAYNNDRVLIKDNEIVVPRDPKDRFKPLLHEHHAYCEANGDYLYHGNYVEGAGGHGAYFAYRPWPFAQYRASNLFYEAPMLWHTADSVLIDMDQMPGRGAFAAQAFNPGDFKHPGEVLLEDTDILLSWDFVRSQGEWNPIELPQDFTPEAAGGRTMNCNGAFVVHHYDVQKHRARSQANSHPTELATVRRCRFDLSFSQMPMAAIRGTRRVMIEDSAFRTDPRHKSPHVWIDDDEAVREICGAEEVVVRNCVAQNASVRIVLSKGVYRDIPLHTPGRVAIWRRANPDAIEMRDYDPAKVYGEAVPA